MSHFFTHGRVTVNTLATVTNSFGLKSMRFTPDNAGSGAIVDGTPAT